MNAGAQAALLFPREQFRMARLQVYNWGTFSDVHDVPVAQEGFLFVGRSGAGKSTLLDAFSALLVPPQWLDFNAAARETERSGRDRNLLSYIRGAWAEQKDGESGEIATRFLRPKTTWSALALTYRNTLGQSVVLVRLFWVRGITTDVKMHFMIFEREMDVRELESFAQSDFDVRRLKQSIEHSYSYDKFRPYSDQFCRLLGIESDRALRLLHKTQSAKNLGDLNIFLRDFMLDKPETFEVAERLVNEFGELNAAHQSVVTAREQVQVLHPARQTYHQHEAAVLQVNELEELVAGLDTYGDERRVALLQTHLIELGVKAAGTRGRAEQLQASNEQHKIVMEGLQNQHRDLGGLQIEHWASEKNELERQRDQRLNKRSLAQRACQALGHVLSDTPEGFAEQAGLAKYEVEQWASEGEAQRGQYLLLGAELSNAESAFQRIRKEITALERQPSNIPSEMLELRYRMTQAIGLAEAELPFVGELLEVKPEHQPWQGAIERVLRGFAISLLVDERHYAAVSTHINTTHLGGQLVYFRVDRRASRPLPVVGNESLALKMNVKVGVYSGWLERELRQRFDYACVDSLLAFRSAERALTREGQAKHNKSRHEKNDRNQIGERRNWVLGFNNREKLSMFRLDAQAQAGHINELNVKLNTLKEDEQRSRIRQSHCQVLINLDWQDIDVASLMLRIDSLDQQIKRVLEGNSALKDLAGQIERARIRHAENEKNLTDILVELEGLRKEISSTQSALEQLRNDLVDLSLTPIQRQGLEARFAEHSMTLERLDHVSKLVERRLRDELTTLNEQITRCNRSIEDAFADFKRRWPMDAGDLDTGLLSADDYFAKLARLQADDLPAHEQRFFELLQSQSHQNLAALSTYLNSARKAIWERLELVNESLRQVPFNQSSHQKTFLSIEPSDRQLVDVREFKQGLQAILRHAWNEDPGIAEERFLALRGLVERLSSELPEHKRWREMVLDVRLHVEFIARELDERGEEVEVYRSGAAKSGGQRQKLATTCLAAALRYQLGGQEHGVPMYAPVVLDEAFDKADNEFTALAMNIFINFGFQMIVATPLKSVMTLEPFIGGACFVDISDRKTSGVLLIEYDLAEQRLQLSDSQREEADSEDSE